MTHNMYLSLSLAFDYLRIVYNNSDGSSAVIENTNSENMHDFVLPYTSTVKTSADNNVPMTAVTRYSLNQKTVDEVDVMTRIVPTPYKTIIEDNANSFNINGISLVSVEPLDNLVEGAFDLFSKLGVNSNGDHQVSFTSGAVPEEVAGSDEAYLLEVTALGTTITAPNKVGLFNGLMSFVGLLGITNNSVMTLKEMAVFDKPRFEYRGHQVDAARNFRSMETILKTIDAMALWKVRFILFHQKSCWKL
jgi:N-acetyl-beta-hexosaminidase